MRALKKMILIAIRMLVAIMTTSMELILKVECWVAGVGFLLLTILAILALVNRMWLQLRILGLIFAGIILVMFLTFIIQIMVDTVSVIMK